MRILFSMTNLDLGGAQMFVMRLAEELSSQGHEVFVYNHMPEWSNMDFQKSFSNSITTLSYEDKHSSFLTWKINAIIKKVKPDFIFRNWLNEKYYKKVLQKYKFDVISSQMYYADKLNAKVAVPLHVPFVVTTHGEYELNFSNHFEDFDKEAKNCLASAQAVIYTAQKNIDAIQSLLSKDKPVHKIIVGFNGDAITRFPVNPAALGIKKGDFVLGMVARGIPEKGWDEAIETFLKLRERNKSVPIHLIMIGNGEDMKKLYEQKKVENLHLLQFTTNTIEYFSWIQYFDAGLLLSYFKGESVPNTIIEYLYFGVPVIATGMGDIKEMITSPSGMAGEIIPLKNGKADTDIATAAIQKWIDDREYYNMLKSKTKPAFEKFNMKKIAAQYMEVFREASGQKK